MFSVYICVYCSWCWRCLECQWHQCRFGSKDWATSC